MAYEGIVQGSAKEFVAYYQSEIQRQVENIREMVAQLRKDASNRALLEEIQGASAAIADLAMVYGFEGVEVIADRIHGAVRRLREEAITDEFLTRLDEATGAIEKAMILIDERREREIVRNLSEQASDSHDFVYVEPAVREETSPDGEESEGFDIKEDEKLLSILSDADGEAYEITSGEISSAHSDKAATQNKELDFHPLSSDELTRHFDAKEKDETVFEELDMEEEGMELDFQRDESEKKKKTGIWGKISRFFGAKLPQKETASHA